jgi:hypothetical protein
LHAGAFVQRYQRMRAGGAREHDQGVPDTGFQGMPGFGFQLQQGAVFQSVESNRKQSMREHENRP